MKCETFESCGSLHFLYLINQLQSDRFLRGLVLGLTAVTTRLTEFYWGVRQYGFVLQNKQLATREKMLLVISNWSYHPYLEAHF